MHVVRSADFDSAHCGQQYQYPAYRPARSCAMANACTGMPVHAPVSSVAIPKVDSVAAY